MVGSTGHVHANRFVVSRFQQLIKLVGVHSGEPEFDDERKVALRICFIICTNLQKYV